MDVGVWLRSLGLGQYEASFRDNEIDGSVLPKLTVDDLKDLGVAVVGHRRKIMSAIEELNAPSARTEDATAPPAQAPVSAGAHPDAAERRQLTVMFCDLVGSTALSARLDPEDMREIIRAYQDACSGAVARYDGFVAKFMGDGVLAYFGFPRAHEDDAERAVRAGLDMAAVVAKLETPTKDKLKVRIGVATGIVVVGDLVGLGSAQEQAVVGDTPNLAARLQALAEPGSLVIAESTKRLLGRTFELNALGSQTLKGFDATVPAWAVLGEAENVSRFEASRPQSLTPFVGREHEVALLLERWRGARDGEGQVVLLSGEAGIGKSRVLAALREGIGSEAHVTIRYQCSPHHVNDAFYPIASHIWHAAGFVSGERSTVRLDRLEAMIARSGPETKDISPYLAALLSIPFEGRYPEIEMAPVEQKERTIAALIDLFVGLTRDAPVLALLEDAHWIDPTSLDLFGRLVDRLPGLCAMLVITFRPEFVAPWLGRAHVMSLSLNRFGRRHALAMIERLAGGKALPAEVLEQIVAKTDGVPLFVEELTKTVLESGLLREEQGGYVVNRALTPLAIPSTLQDSLMARLDRLAPVKEIAQIGAAIGREFSYRLLETVAPIKSAALQDALGQLMAAELIHGRGTPPEASYVFKHALVQDTAYSSLLRSRRQRIHADIARALGERFADKVDAAPAIVAHHYAEAGLVELAMRAWLAAAELAQSRSAHAEASHSADAGLALLPSLPNRSDFGRLELALQLARCNAVKALKGFAAEATVEAMTEAQRLLDAGIGDDLQRLFVVYGLCWANFFAGRLERTLELAGQIIEIAGRSDDATYRVVGYRSHGTALFFMGRHREALESLNRGERYRDPSLLKRLSYGFGQDPGLAVLCFQSLALTFVGLVDQAAGVGEQILAELPGHGHSPTVATCTFLVLVLRPWLLDEFEECERQSADLVAYCTDKGVGQYRLLGANFHALARVMLAPTPENIAALRAGIETYRQTGTGIGYPTLIYRLAEALLISGDARGAEAELRKAFASVEESGERYQLSELHRVEGRIALKRPAPDPARAEACFLRAIEIAHAQEARLLELRAATHLARLWRDTGSPHDPRALLEPILAMIEGGETLRDVRDARALLTENG
jgi:class 3 adenylate cyclase/tetratricopeptide (TPR) repeat protein